MKSVAAKCKDACAAKAMISSLSKISTQDDLQNIANEMAKESKANKVVEAEDVTAAFLEPEAYHGPVPLASQYFVYRGLVQALVGRKIVSASKDVGIMAGSNDIVHEVCIASEVKNALCHPELMDRWTNQNFELMGLVVWDACKDHDHDKYKEDMALLMSKQASKPLLLLICHSGSVEAAWEFNAEHCPNGFVHVELNNKNKNRRKDTDFKVFALERIGVTFDDTAKFLVTRAIQEQIAVKLQNVSKQSNHDWLPFKKYKVPADGYCFWHSVLAGLQPKTFQSVPRYRNGFAVNPRQEKQEFSAAKELMQMAASDMDGRMLFQNGFVDLFQIQSVGQQLNLAIRVTIEDEAGCYTYIQ